jgi:hypothetical protein
MNEKYFYDLTYTNFKICGDELILQASFRKCGRNNCCLRYAGRINLSFRGVKRSKFLVVDDDDELLYGEPQINK